MKVHTGEKPFSCDQCGKSFRCEKSCDIHMRIHTGEKPYKCSYCDKRFSQLSCLKTHEKIHSRENPHTCDQLKIHMKIHEVEEPHHRRFKSRTTRKHLEGENAADPEPAE